MPKQPFKDLVVSEKEKVESVARKLNRLLQSYALQTYYKIKQLQNGELVILENASNPLTSEIRDRLDKLMGKLSLRNIIDFKKTRIRSGAHEFNGFIIEQIDYGALHKYELIQNQKVISKPEHINVLVWSRLPPEIKESWTEFSRELQDHIVTCYVKNIDTRLAALPEGVQLGTASLQTPILFDIPVIPVYLPNPLRPNKHSSEFYDLMEILKFPKGEDPTNKIPFLFDEIIPATDKLTLIDERLAAQEQKVAPSVPVENLARREAATSLDNKQPVYQYSDISTPNPLDSGLRKRFRQQLEGMDASTRAATLEYQSIDSLQKLSNAYSMLLNFYENEKSSPKDQQIQIQTMKIIQKEISLSIFIQKLSQQLKAIDPTFKVTRNENEFIAIMVNIQQENAFREYIYKKALYWPVKIQNGQMTVYLDKDKILGDPNILENIKANLNATASQNIIRGNEIKNKLNDNKNNIQREEQDISFNKKSF